MLGTVITEWEEGAALCEQLFSSPEAAEEAAGQLCRIAAHHGFDGWLLNVENTLSEAAIPNLLHFIRCAQHDEIRKYYQSTGKAHVESTTESHDAQA